MRHLHLLLSTPLVHITAKPPWLLTNPGVHDAARPSASTLLFAHLAPGSAFPPTPSHLVCHRLDCATSGLLLLAASPAGSSGLGAAFRTPGALRKGYEALVDATRAALPLAVGDSGEVALPLGRRAGVPLLHTCAGQSGGARTALRAAVTRWRVLQREGALARLALTPLTGRTHQLRLHCAMGLGAPIVGDALYGAEAGGARGFAADLRARRALAGAGAPGEEEALYLAEAQARSALPHVAGWRLMLHARSLQLPRAVLCGEGGGSAAMGSLAALGEEGAAQEGGAGHHSARLVDDRGGFVRGSAAQPGAAFVVSEGEGGALVLDLPPPF